MKISQDLYFNKKIKLGYDYLNQAWILDDKYLRCGHDELMNCNCFGRLHQGEEVKCSYTLLEHRS